MAPKIALFVFLFSVYSRASWELKEGWDVVLTQSQFEYGEETFNLYSVYPYDIKAELDKLPEPERARKVKKFWAMRREANQMLHLIKEFIYLHSTRASRRPMVDEEEFPKLANHLEKVLSGRYPFSVVTAYNNPFRIYQLFGKGFDEQGLPLERRLVGRAMLPLPRPQKTVSPVPICYVPPRGNRSVIRR